MRDIRVSFVLPLLFLGFVVPAPMAMSQSFGTFTATGSMTAPRVNHTATLLPDGRVLIAGGNTACFIGFPSCLTPDHAEIYDPATGTFTATGSVSIAFPDEGGTVLLPDGKVLVFIAGFGVKFYDPSTIAVYSTALLNDGRVLLIGNSAAELYDPVSGTVSPVAFNWPGQDTGYWYPVLLASRKVLLAPYDSLSGCEIYDPATGTFNLTGALGYFLGVPIGRCF